MTPHRPNGSPSSTESSIGGSDLPQTNGPTSGHTNGHPFDHLTPQAVLDGRDWRDWGGAPGRVSKTTEPAQASISLKQVAPDQFEALVTPVPGVSGKWSAYWTLTEDGHSSRVKSGENAGEFLKHDFVVRQYTPAGDYDARAISPQKLAWRSIAATPGHARRINLVVFDPSSGKTLQAVSASCNT